MQFFFRLIFYLFYLFNFHVSHEKILNFPLLNKLENQCSVNFGVQSDIPSSLISAFFKSFRIDRQKVLDRDNLLHGHCIDFFLCPTWRIATRYSPVWIRPVFRQLHCGRKEDDGTALYCCPEVAGDTPRIVFPDESSAAESGTTEAAHYNTHPNRLLLPGLGQNDCQTKLPRMGRILGGKSAGIGQYPWIVRLAYKSSDRGSFSNSRDLEDDGSPEIDFRCGGVLLNDRYVMTAAHCLRDTNDTIFMVRLGELDVRSNPDCEPTLLGSYEERGLMRCADRVIDVAVAQSIVHERFDVPYRQNDIALLRLNASIKLTDWIRPICLPFDWPWPSLHHSSSSLDPVLVGWGRDDSFQFPETLQRVRLGWYNITECRLVYSNAHPRSISISESFQFCLGGAGRGDVEGGVGHDTCQGDSGGPVMLTGPIGGNEGYERVYAIGIISLGPWMCGNGFPSVYTWVHGYLTWILDNVVA